MVQVAGQLGAEKTAGDRREARGELGGGGKQREETRMKRAVTLRRGRGGGGDGGSRTATRAGRRDRLREWEKQRIHCAMRQMRLVRTRVSQVGVGGVQRERS